MVINLLQPEDFQLTEGKELRITLSKYHATGMTQTMIVVNSDNHAMKTGLC